MLQFVETHIIIKLLLLYITMDKNINPKSKIMNDSVIKNPLIKETTTFIIEDKEEDFDKDYFRGGSNLKKVYKIHKPLLKN
jgi:hypothetical protein